MLDDDLMTRREVAYKFGVHSATVKNWARSAQVGLTEVRDGEGQTEVPPYRGRAAVCLRFPGIRDPFRRVTAEATVSTWAELGRHGEPDGVEREPETSLEPCKRCGGLAGVHWLTCPALRYPPVTGEGNG